MPEIRISEATFRQLEEIARPFTDTPDTVIARLLDQQSSRNGTKGNLSTSAFAKRGLYLAPASRENIQASIDKPVVRADIAYVLDDRSAARLDEAIGDRATFHCWAMTRARRAMFNRMRRGDVVLLALKGTGRFQFRATVAGKLECEALGSRLWPFRNGLPFSLIYVFDQVMHISVSKAALVRELGFKPDFVVPGVIRVDDQQLAAAEKRYGGLDELLNALTT